MNAASKTGLWIIGTIAMAGALWWADAESKGPHKMVLRTTIQWIGDKPIKASRIQEWRLAIPKEFLVRKDAYDSTPFDPSLRNGELGSHNNGYRFFWTISGLAENEKVLPIKGNDLRPQFSFTLSNGLVAKSASQQDYCMPEDVWEPLHGLKGCEAHQLACSIYLNFHGWPAEVSVAKQGLYQDPQHVCQIARTTLNSWTVSIDDLRFKEKN